MYDAKAQLDALVGVVLKDRFELKSVLGAGGMGAVFDGWDRQFDSAVAIKIILPSIAQHEGARHELKARFRREAKNTFQLKHHNIVTVTDFGEDPEHEMLFLVMERLVGKDLERELQSEGRIAPRRAVKILAQACSAIDFAHQHDQIHRDLKPSNIMLIKRGREPDFVKVLDFGLARGVSGEDKLSGTGQLLGTPHYMAPEQAGARPLDQRCDIYAMGAVAYHLLAGTVPFGGTTISAILLAQQATIQEPLWKVVPGFPKALSDVVDKALQKRPEARFATMEDLREALETAVRAAPDPQVRVTPASVAVPDVSRVISDSQPGLWGAPPPDAARVEPAADAPEAPQRSAITPRVAELPLGDNPAATIPPVVLSSSAVVALERRRVAIGARVDVPHAHAGIMPATRATIAALDDGSAAIVYEASATGVSRLGVQLVRGDLGVAAPQLVTRGASIALAPAVAASAGRVLVAWVDARGGSSQIHAGVWAPDRKDPVTETALGEVALRAAAPVIAPTKQGAIVAWHETGAAKASRVAVVLIDRAGKVVGGPVRSINAAYPTLACGDDSSLIAWHECVAGDQATRSIRVCSIALAHGTSSTPLRWPHVGTAAFPVLAHGTDGFAMLWWCAEPTPSMMISRVGSDGTLVGESVRLGPASKQAQRGALVPVAGGFVASWTGRPTEGVVTCFVPADLAGPIAPPLMLDESCPTSAALARFGEGACAVWSMTTPWAPHLHLTRLDLVPA